MNVVESLRLGWRSIRGHKLRSTLTTLGIIIGIGAVIAFTMLGAGLKADVLGDVSGENEPVLLVYTEQQTQGGGVQIGNTPIFTEHDLAQVRGMEHVEWVAPAAGVPVIQVTHANRTITGGIGASATVPERFQNVTFQAGGAFTAGEREAVVNPELVSAFDGNVSVGDTLVLRRAGGAVTNVTVTGVLNESIGFSIGQGSSQPQLYLPTDPFYTTTVARPGGGDEQKAYAGFSVRLESIEYVDEVQPEVRNYLENSSDAREFKSEEYAFRVQTAEGILDQINDILNQITGFITGIAVISLIVGSIGIANIMLVSVTERTREIGIMKAIGAKRRDVLQLFLVESVILGIVGAVFGVLLGIAGGYAGTAWLDMPTVYPVEWFVIAIVVGVVVGIVAGLYPAWRGARVDPIEALRYE